MWTYTFASIPEKPESVFFDMESFEYSHSKSGQYRPYHVHDRCHVMFCTAGSGFLRIGNTDLMLSAGTLAVIRPGQYHSCGTDSEEGFTFWGLSFGAGQAARESWDFFRKQDSMTASYEGYQDYVDGVFRYMYDVARTADPPESVGRVLALQAAALLAFARTMLSEHSLSLPVPEEQPMEDILKWIAEHYTEKITLNSLAKEFAMSSSHLSRSFCQAYRVSPINYLIDYRLNIAKDLLIQTELPVHRIAEQVGYDNSYYFVNLFTRRIGYTPQDFRYRCQNGDTQPTPAVFGGGEQDSGL